MKLYRIDFEAGEPMMLRLSDEQVAEWRKDPRVAKVTAAKAADEKATSPSLRSEPKS